jgi:hypothetical protein
LFGIRASWVLPFEGRDPSLQAAFSSPVGVRSRSRQVNQAVFVETGEDVRGAGDEGRWKQALGYDRLQLSPTNGRLLPVKRAGACTAEVRGSNPLRSREPPWVPGAHNPSTIQCVSTEANGLRGLFCWDDGPWPANAEMSLRRRILGSRLRGWTDQRDREPFGLQSAFGGRP